MVTVLFATHNGASTLPTVLEGYTRLKSPPGGWKLVAVDNASRDDTTRILERFTSKLPMTRLNVAQAGKNNALNGGLEACEGELIVLTDDDTVPVDDWLVELERATDERPEYDLFGGAIRPRWPRPPDPWLLEWVPQGITFTVTDSERESGPVPATFVWGPNMAVRRRVFDEGHRFDGTIGPDGTANYPMGSETEFTTRLERLGYKAWFVSTAVVEHMIRPYQMDRAWILSRAERFGRGLFQRERASGEAHPATVLGIPRYQIRQIAQRLLRLAAAKLARSSRRTFEEAWALRRDWGYVQEARRSRHSRQHVRPPED